MRKPAVLLIGFNRPDLTERVLASIKEYAPPRLYFACDGPRSGVPSDYDLVSRVRDLVSTVDWQCEVFTRFQVTNQGLRENVVGALDWFYGAETEGIVLEDDCIPNADFFRLMAHILEKYRNSQQVMGATGSNYARVSFSPATYGFVRVALIWGWATWADRWALYDRDLQVYRSQLSKAQSINWQNPSLKHALKWHLDKTVKSGPNSWDYQLAWSLVLKKKLWIVPGKNTIENRGFRKDATHTVGKPIGNQSMEGLGEIVDPEVVEVSLAAENKILRTSHRVLRPLWLNYVRDVYRNLRHRD